MHRIDGAGATIDNKFTEGNPATGVPATTVTAEWLNAVQEEVSTAVEATGAALDKTKTNQLLTAISAVDSIAALRALPIPKQRVEKDVLGYYAPGDGGGGQFYWDTASTAADNGGTIILPTGYTGTGRWIRNDNKELDVRWFGTGASDDTAAIQAAVNAASGTYHRRLYFPDGWYTITRQITIPDNSGLSLIGAASRKGAVTLNVAGWTGGVDDAVFHVVGGSESYAGLTIANMHLIGNDTVCHAVRVKYVSHPMFSNVLIEGFKGSGLYIDKCQDGEFYHTDVHNCGRTTGNYASAADCANESLTTSAPVLITSSVAGDSCNYLRFRSCQWENNKVSPSVKIDSGIQLYFTDGHSEHRQNVFVTGNTIPAGTLFWVGDADVQISGWGCVQFATYLKRTGYGNTFIDSVARGADIDLTPAANKTLSLYMVNSILGNVSISSAGGAVKATGCKFTGNLSISYPANSPYVFANCNIDGNVTVTDNGAGGAGVWILDSNILGSVEFAVSTSFGKLIDCAVGGNLTFNSPNGTCVNNRVSGTTSVQLYDVKMYRPFSKAEHFASAAPIYGSWLVGDVVWNSAVAAGGKIGWVCVAAGAPGTWKPFGAIDA